MSDSIIIDGKIEQNGEQLGIVRVLERLLHERVGTELVDGVSVEEAAGWVDLSIEHTPVIPFPAPLPDGRMIFRIPIVMQAYETQGGHVYTLERPLYPNSLGQVEAAEIKIMRARFLLWRGMVYKCLTSEMGITPYTLRREAEAAFFPHGIFMPVDIQCYQGKGEKNG